MRPLSFLHMQHLVDQRPKVHLNHLEFTLKYRDGLRKVVDNLGRGLIRLGGWKIDRPCWRAMANLLDIGHPYTAFRNLTGGWTRIIAASATVRDDRCPRG